MLNLFALNAVVFNRYLKDAFSTHQPVLYAAALASKGPIVEFGCGYGSTDLLHEICKKDGRLLISLDDNKKWLNRFKEKYKNEKWHHFYFVPGKNENNRENPSHWIHFLETNQLLNNTFFGVCFIDQSPWLGRYETLKRMKDKSQFVIVHDADYFPEHGIFGKVIKPINRKKRVEGEFDFSDVFAFFEVYFPSQSWPAETGPPTLIGSNFESRIPHVDYFKEINTPE